MRQDLRFIVLKKPFKKGKPFTGVVTKAALQSSGGPAVTSNPGLLHENPVLCHKDTDTVLHSLTHSLTHSDNLDDIVHYGLARTYKKLEKSQKKVSFPVVRPSQDLEYW